MKGKKLNKAKKLLIVESILIAVAITLLLTGALIAIFMTLMTKIWQIILACVGVFVCLLLGIVIAFLGLWFESKAGHYECAKCGHHHTPSYWRVALSPHVSTTRYLKCPKCGEKSWNKKNLED